MIEGFRQMLELVYASRPFGYDNLTLYDILSVARQNNKRDGITGALVCREDLYLQLLEGPADAVTAAYKRIIHDGRHSEITKLSSTTKTDRLFPEWAMRDDPARSWMWTVAEVRAGAVERASSDEVRNVFFRLATNSNFAQSMMRNRIHLLWRHHKTALRSSKSKSASRKS